MPMVCAEIQVPVNAFMPRRNAWSVSHAGTTSLPAASARTSRASTERAYATVPSSAAIPPSSVACPTNVAGPSVVVPSVSSVVIDRRYTAGPFSRERE